MVATATSGGEHQTDADVLSRCVWLAPASLGNNLQRFSFERENEKKRERNIVSELMMEKNISASARAQAIIGNFVIYEFMNCAEIHLSRRHTGDRIGFNCIPHHERTSLIPVLGLKVGRKTERK